MISVCPLRCVLEIPKMNKPCSHFEKAPKKKNDLSWNPVYSFWRTDPKLICRVSCNGAICLIEMSSQYRLFVYCAGSDGEKQRFFPFFVTCDENIFTRQLVSKKRCSGLSCNNLTCGKQMLFSALVSPAKTIWVKQEPKKVSAPCRLAITQISLIKWHFFFWLSLTYRHHLKKRRNKR